MAKATKYNRINKLFEEKKDGSKIASLFLTAGYPDLESTAELILGMEANGADMIELGMPFSDPLADGPTIQFSSNQAIENGITQQKIFDIVKQVRRKSEIPIVLMGYLNPVVKYGATAFCSDAKEAGVDGLIIPDMPPEESGIIREPAEEGGLAVVYLVAPNTSDERMQLIDSKSSGFVYCVSVTGVTGAREADEVTQSVRRFIDRVEKNINRNPTMIGFGIKSHRDAQRVARQADGFIVGSALIDIIRANYPEEGWKEAAFDFVHELKYG